MYICDQKTAQVLFPSFHFTCVVITLEQALLTTASSAYSAKFPGQDYMRDVLKAHRKARVFWLNGMS